jgi:hypothetical protein
MFYTPIIKQKEFECLYMSYLLDAFQNKSIIPFLEIRDNESPKTKQSRSKALKLINKLSQDKPFFIGIPRVEDFESTYERGKWLFNTANRPFTYCKETINFLYFSTKAIPCFYLEKEDVSKESLIFIDVCHKANRPCALFVTGNEEFTNESINTLSSNDYLFVNIGTNLFDAKKPLLQSIAYKTKAGIVPIRENRTYETFNSIFEDNTLTNVILPDLENDVKNSFFVGFGDYAGLKNSEKSVPANSNPEKRFATCALYQKTIGEYLVIKSDKSLAKSDLREMTLCKKLLDRKSRIDPNDDYGIYPIIKDKIPGNGTPGQANALTLVYYIYQMNKWMKI